MHSKLESCRPPRRRHVALVVRLWDDATQPAQDDGRQPLDESGLRGSVQVVGRDTMRYFASLNGLRDILQDVAAAIGHRERSSR